MKNQVIAGNYKDWDIIISDKIYFMRGLKKVVVDKMTVAKYEVIDDIDNNSFWKPLVAGGIGGMLFGGLGMVVGAAAGLKKQQNFLISIEFLNGEKSLLEVDAKGYKEIIRAMF